MSNSRFAPLMKAESCLRALAGLTIRFSCPGELGLALGIRFKKLHGFGHQARVPGY